MARSPARFSHPHALYQVPSLPHQQPPTVITIRLQPATHLLLYRHRHHHPTDAAHISSEHGDGTAAGALVQVVVGVDDAAGDLAAQTLALRREGFVFSLQAVALGDQCALHVYRFRRKR